MVLFRVEADKIIVMLDLPGLLDDIFDISLCAIALRSTTVAVTYIESLL